MTASAAAPAPATEVAIVDLRDLRHPEIARRRALGRRIADVCRSVGFFYVVEHGVPAATIESMFALSRRFFELSMNDKMAVSTGLSAHWRGYLPAKMIGNDPTMIGNILEAFHVWQEHSPDDPGLLAEKPLHGVNQWPAQMPGMRAEVLAYAAAVTALARDMVKVAALGIGLPEDAFLKHFDQPMALLRLIHYPPQAIDPTEGRYGTRPHTDNGAFTILAQDDTGGLEILGANEAWVAVPPVKNSFVINLGEVMKVWTNGLFMATPHRVINTSGKDRYSLPFFLNPSYDAVIAPMLREKAGKVEPVFHTTVETDRPITSGEILTRLYRRIWPSSHDQQLN